MKKENIESLKIIMKMYLDMLSDNCILYGEYKQIHGSKNQAEIEGMERIINNLKEKPMFIFEFIKNDESDSN